MTDELVTTCTTCGDTGWVFRRGPFADLAHPCECMGGLPSPEDVVESQTVELQEGQKANGDCEPTFTANEMIGAMTLSAAISAIVTRLGVWLVTGN